MVSVVKRLRSFVFPAVFVLTAAGQTTNTVSLPSAALPDVGVSLLRVLGALALVLAIFLGGVWLFRNWQRLVARRGRVPRLNVLEVRSLGGRHALYVVGYEQERFLIGASPAGVHLVSHLQPAGEEAPDNAAAPQASFAQAFTRMLKGKAPTFGGAGE
jgi:flagellar biogenesis protein FliO